MESRESSTETGRGVEEGVEEIVRIVIHTLAAEKERSRLQDHNRWQRLADGIKSYWPLIAAVGSLGLALLAYLTFQISPLESYRQIAERRQERQFQQQMAQRHLQLGIDFLNVNQIQPAKTEFTRVRELEPYNVDAELGLLKVSVFEMFEPSNIEGFDPEIAERRLSAILQQHPNDTHALTFLGMVYRTPDPAQAEAYFDKAMAADPQNALAYFQKGFLLDLRGDRVEALRLYGEASRRSKWNQAFLNNLAYQYFQRQDYARAEAAYLQLLNLDARLVLSYIMLTNTELILGKVDNASLFVTDLLRKLNDGVTAKLARNHNEWYFHAEPDPTRALLTDAEKLAYIRYVAALTAYLRGRSREVHDHLEQIAQEPAGKDSALLVLQSDLRRLAGAQPTWAAAITGFAALVGTGR